MTPAEIIAQFNKLLLHEANEAATRLKVVDHVIFDVLKWTHDDVNVEERVSEDGSTTWADYVLRTGMTSIVIEAKKAGTAFDTVPDVRRAKLSGKFVSGELGAAIAQARDYARKLSIPFAAVTNGNSWVFFPATRIDQVPFQESSAVVFQDLKSALETDFSEFFETFSRDATIRGSLEYELLGRVENQIDDHRLNRYYTTNFSKISRHSFFPLIEDAVTTAFSQDIVNTDPKLLDICYVKTPERVRFDDRIRMHVQKRDSVLPRASARPLKDGRNPVADLIGASSRKARPVAMLVLGTVGSGKTMFLNHTRRIEAESVFASRSDAPYPHWIYVDFLTYVPSGSSALDYIYSALKAHVDKDGFLSDYERCIRHAYKEEMEALFKGPLFLYADDPDKQKEYITKLLMTEYEATKPYVDKVIGYAARHSPVFLVVDNVDQIADDNTQSSIFAEVMSLSQKLGVNLIFAMREATYVRYRNTPLFDAFDFDPISIDPPQISAVLSRRFFLTQKLLEGRPGSFIAENGANVEVEDLSVVIDVIKDSVLGSEIGNLIEVLATSDVRMALRMTREFLQSGWTATGKALEIFLREGKYMMPRHEALRAIMLGNQSVYYEEFSVIGNPFDSRIAKTEAQLLRLYVLNATVQMASDRSFRYLEGLEIQEVCRSLGFGDNITMRILRDLTNMRFLHTTTHGAAKVESNYIPTRLGGYIVRHFLSDMMFLENIMMDTFIPSRDVWDELYNLTGQIYAQRNTIRRLETRIDRVRCFFKYMMDLFEPLRTESIRRGFRSEWCSSPLGLARSQLETNLEGARASALRIYG